MTAHTHHLLLALAGRVDDDLLATARELVAVGEESQACEILVATLVADRTPLPADVRAQVVELAAARQIEPSAEGLAPAGDGVRHTFGAGPAEASTALNQVVAAVVPAGSSVRLAWRHTPAGGAPGPVPHPVLLVELGESAYAPEVVSYRLGSHLARAGLPASVEVYAAADDLPAYHKAALAAAGVKPSPVPRAVPREERFDEPTTPAGLVAVAPEDRGGRPGDQRRGGVGESAVAGAAEFGAAAGTGAGGLGSAAAAGGSGDPVADGGIGVGAGVPAAEAGSGVSRDSSGIAAVAGGLGLAGARGSAADAGGSGFSAAAGESGRPAAAGGSGGDLGSSGAHRVDGTAGDPTAASHRAPEPGSSHRAPEPGDGPAGESVHRAGPGPMGPGVPQGGPSRAPDPLGPWPVTGDPQQNPGSRRRRPDAPNGETLFATADRQGPRADADPRAASAEAPSPLPVLGAPLREAPPTPGRPLRPLTSPSAPDSQATPGRPHPLTRPSEPDAEATPARPLRPVSRPSPVGRSESPGLPGAGNAEPGSDEPPTSPFGPRRTGRSLSVVPPVPGQQPPRGPRPAPVTRPTPVVPQAAEPTPVRPWTAAPDDPPVLASMHDPLSGPLREPLLDAQLDRTDTGPIAVVGVGQPDAPESGSAGRGTVGGLGSAGADTGSDREPTDPVGPEADDLLGSERDAPFRGVAALRRGTTGPEADESASGSGSGFGPRAGVGSGPGRRAVGLADTGQPGASTTAAPVPSAAGAPPRDWIQDWASGAWAMPAGGQRRRAEETEAAPATPVVQSDAEEPADEPAEDDAPVRLGDLLSSLRPSGGASDTHSGPTATVDAEHPAAALGTDDPTIDASPQDLAAGEAREDVRPAAALPSDPSVPDPLSASLPDRSEHETSADGHASADDQGALRSDGAGSTPDPSSHLPEPTDTSSAGERSTGSRPADGPAPERSPGERLTGTAGVDGPTGELAPSDRSTETSPVDGLSGEPASPERIAGAGPLDEPAPGADGLTEDLDTGSGETTGLGRTGRHGATTAHGDGQDDGSERAEGFGDTPGRTDRRQHGLEHGEHGNGVTAAEHPLGQDADLERADGAAEHAGSHDDPATAPTGDDPVLGGSLVDGPGTNGRHGPTEQVPGTGQSSPGAEGTEDRTRRSEATEDRSTDSSSDFDTDTVPDTDIAPDTDADPSVAADAAPTGRRAAVDGAPTSRPLLGGRRRSRHRPDDDSAADPWSFGSDMPRPAGDDGLPPPRPVPRSIPRVRRAAVDDGPGGLFGPGEVPPARSDGPFGTGPRPGNPSAGGGLDAPPPESLASLSSREQELLRRLHEELAVREDLPDGRRNGSER